jgi:hypothetical protein
MTMTCDAALAAAQRHIEADKRAGAPPAKDCAKDPADPRNH